MISRKSQEDSTFDQNVKMWKRTDNTCNSNSIVFLTELDLTKLLTKVY